MNFISHDFSNSLLVNEKNALLSLVKTNGNLLSGANNDLRANKEFVLMAVRNNGNSLIDACDELRNDKDVVLQAVKNNGDALQFASDELRNDKNIVLAAINKNTNAFRFASDALKNDLFLAIEVMMRDYSALNVLKNHFFKVALCWPIIETKDILLMFIYKNIGSIKFAKRSVKKDLYNFLLSNDDFFTHITESYNPDEVSIMNNIAALKKEENLDYLYNLLLQQSKKNIKFYDSSVLSNSVVALFHMDNISFSNNDLNYNHYNL